MSYVRAYRIHHLLLHIEFYAIWIFWYEMVMVANAYSDL